MKFSLNRQLLLKGIDVPNLPNNDEPTTPEQLATPKWISATHSGRLAAKLAGKKLPLVLPNRAYVRGVTPKVRRRVRGVALPPERMPWKTVSV